MAKAKLIDEDPKRQAILDQLESPDFAPDSNMAYRDGYGYSDGNTYNGDGSPAGATAPAGPANHDVGGMTDAPDFAGPTGGAATTQQAPFDRTKFRDTWQSSSGSMADFLKAHPEFAPYIKPHNGSMDKFELPTGEVLDLVTNVSPEGTGAHGWNGTGFDVNGRPDGGASPAMAAATSTTAQPAGSSNAQIESLLARLQSGGASNAFLTSIRQMLMARLNQIQNAGDPNTLPEVQQPLAAAEREAEKVRRRRQDAAAERLTAEGVGDSGALDSEVARSYDAMSSDLSGLSGDLVSRVMTQRRDEIQQLLQMAMQSGDAESARELQSELALLNNELQRAQLAQQGRQFDANLGYQYANLGQQGAQFNAQLGEQGRQFDDTLGFDQARFYADDEYRKAVLAAMGSPS